MRKNQEIAEKHELGAARRVFGDYLIQRPERQKIRIHRLIPVDPPEARINPENIRGYRLADFIKTVFNLLLRIRRNYLQALRLPFFKDFLMTVLMHFFIFSNAPARLAPQMDDDLSVRITELTGFV